MSKMSTFLSALYRSFTSLDYYYDITQARFSFTIKYFIGFTIIYAALNAALLYTNYVQPLKPVVDSLPSHFSTVFPEDLTIIISNGQVSINQQEPYFIGTERLLRAMYQLRDQVLGADSRNLDYLLVVDTNSGIEDFYTYNTFALLTKNSLIYLDPSYDQFSSGQIRVKALPLVGITAVINQQVVEQMLLQTLPMLRGIIPAILIVFFFLSLFILPYFHLLYISLMSLILLFIGKILHMNLTYAKYFQICTHLFASTSLALITLKLIGLYLPLPIFRSTIIVLASIVVLVHIRHMTLNRRQQLKVS